MMKVTDARLREPFISKSDLAFLILLCAVTSFGFLLIPQSQKAPAAGASITGSVRFSGAAPKLDRAKCISPEVCGKTHSYDRLVVGKNGGVEYTLVYIANPPAGKANFPAPTITQVDCGYTPHMAIASRGASVTFVNKDPVLHNVHGYYFIGNDRSTAFNFAQPTKDQSSDQQLRKAGMVNVECDAGHTWMSSWIWVTDNPYAAVTKADGSYSIDGLPPGTYTVVMWHEGWKTVDTQPGGRPVFSGAIVEQHQVTVPAGGGAITDFELK